MKWLTVNIRHDKGFLRMTERPLLEHLADKFNEIENTYGKIIHVITIQHKDDEYWEGLVKIDETLSQT